MLYHLFQWLQETDFPGIHLMNFISFRAIAAAVVSAVLACALLGVIVYAIYPLMPHVEQIVTWKELTVTALAVFAFSFAIMVMCTLFSVNRFLKMTAGELYKI